MARNFNKLYKVLPDEKVFLRITIGYGQPSATTLRLRGEEILHEHADDVMPNGEWLELGVGADLHDSSLIGVTSIQDTNPATDMASVHYFLRGGVRSWDDRMQDDLGENGTADFVGIIEFYIPRASTEVT